MTDLGLHRMNRRQAHTTNYVRGLLKLTVLVAALVGLALALIG